MIKTARRLRDLIRGLRLAKQYDRRQRWSRDQLAAYQRERVGRLVEHATRCSAFYRRLYGGVVEASEVELDRLPTVSKAAMMDNFDEVVTDAALRREDIEAHLTETPTATYDRRYHVMRTSGSTGERALFVYGANEWRHAVATLLAGTAIGGLKPKLPRERVAVISAPGVEHIAARQADSIDLGLYKTTRHSATEPLEALVARLNAQRPHGIAAYPSIMAMLAREATAGRLDVAPRWLMTYSELRTPPMVDTIEKAWPEAELFEGFGMTEAATVAHDCTSHRGLHVLEDSVILESVDDENRPVPPGTAGARVLLTNLWQETQPLIRYEVGDMIAFDESPCECGRTSKRMVSIEGRSDDVLELPGAAGGVVSVHPIHLRKPLGGLSTVAQYQVWQKGSALDVHVIPSGPQDEERLRSQVREALAAALRQAGVAELPTEVRLVEAIPRAGGGKLKLIERAR